MIIVGAFEIRAKSLVWGFTTRGASVVVLSMSVLLFKLSEVSARPASGAFYAVIVPSAD
jgi:hypothetical protein